MERSFPMAVGAHDVALGCFIEDSGLCSTPGPRDQETLLVGVSMVEFHDVRRQPLTAVDTGMLTKPEQEVAYLQCAETLRPPPARVLESPARAALFCASARLGVGPDRVAVRANDVAFRDLFEESLSILKHRA